VGQGFSFGAQRAGGLQTLQQLGREHGFEAHGLESVRVASIMVSSSKVREFLLLGKVGGGGGGGGGAGGGGAGGGGGL
jgi:FAD synthase